MAQYIIDNRPTPIDFEADSDPLRRTIQNCKNLLMTRMGEIPYDRYRGLDPALFDLPIQEMNEALVPELDRVMLWEPDAEVVDAVAVLEEGGRCVITVTLEIDLGGRG